MAARRSIAAAMLPDNHPVTRSATAARSMPSRAPRLCGGDAPKRILGRFLEAGYGARGFARPRVHHVGPALGGCLQKHRAGPKTPRGPPPDDWTPASLPPEIAAPTLLAAMAFLAAESDSPMPGVTWSPSLLLDGEGETIDAETLVWHLSATDAALVRALFAKPLVSPFGVLLAALRADRRGLGPTHEAARRRQGFGANPLSAKRKSAGAIRGNTKRNRGSPPSARYALSRLMAATEVPRGPVRMMRRCRR
jgi:hypothetical protein